MNDTIRFRVNLTTKTSYNGSPVTNLDLTWNFDDENQTVNRHHAIIDGKVYDNLPWSPYSLFFPFAYLYKTPFDRTESRGYQPTYPSVTYNHPDVEGDLAAIRFWDTRIIACPGRDGLESARFSNSAANCEQWLGRKLPKYLGYLAQMWTYLGSDMPSDYLKGREKFKLDASHFRTLVFYGHRNWCDSLLAQSDGQHIDMSGVDAYAERNLLFSSPVACADGTTKPLQMPPYGSKRSYKWAVFFTCSVLDDPINGDYGDNDELEVRRAILNARVVAGPNTEAYEDELPQASAHFWEAAAVENATITRCADVGFFWYARTRTKYPLFRFAVVGEGNIRFRDRGP
ncbi:MAG TPA: hypothetical protein PL033_09950 [Candidatus Brocadiia bacterium]|nr:hypothetical protein [Candidatus Brocadiia bacterium]